MASAHDCRQMVRDDDRRLILHQSVERLLRFGDELVYIGQFRGGAFSHPAATRDAAAPRTSSLVPLNKASDEDGLRAGRPSFQKRQLDCPRSVRLLGAVVPQLDLYSTGRDD
jgi:hypothetical protein